MMKTYKEIVNEHEIFSKHSIKCKCGHTMLITTKDGKDICKHCGEYAFINKQAEIRYRNKEMLIKARRELNDK